MLSAEVPTKQWHILWFNSADSKKLDSVISGFDAQLWTPTYSKAINASTSERIPMYPSYHMVLCAPEITWEIEARCRDLKYKAVQFLRDSESHKPLYATDDEVAVIQDLENSFTETEEFFVDEEVIICHGPFNDYKGIIKEVQKNWLKIEFVFFGSEARTLSVKKAYCQKIA